MISFSYLSIYTWFSHYLIEHFQCYFPHSKLKLIILNSYEHFKIIESNPQLNLVNSFRNMFSSDSYLYYHLSCTSDTSIFKSYHSISQSRIKLILPNIIGSNFYQLQTSLTLHCLLHIVILTITYRVNSYGDVSVVFVVLTILSHTHS